MSKGTDGTEHPKQRISTTALVQFSVFLVFAVIGLFALPYAAESALLQQLWVAFCATAGF
ncbi:DUF2644 domain-containing protein [Oceanibaculum sp.]|uniref:DUF2644 domain-containing protein n=1 Tax=Oceanibaculum sp. TaxID=1903597 RepID=UPI00258A6754|nr:DUF2644 domain-containing protein [Oceanibaculum sp.]MCH2395185.1 DUF2644 domain-containing protein [Oceanibaculum sp.]